MAREVTVTIETTSAGITVDPGDTRVVRLYRDGDPVPATNGIPAGGTTGQVLAKASNADYDADWVTGGGGSSVWGGITGTLSDQTDLQAALDAKEASGTAAAAVAAHVAAVDPHADRAYTDSAIATKLDDLSAGTADAIVTASADGTLLSRAAYTIATLLAAARDRATHTGTQLASTISDFAAAALSAVTWSTLTGKPSTFDPTAHAASHQGGSDPIAELAAQSQATWAAGVGTTESVVSPAKIAAAISALASGGSPGGSSGQLQYNNAGAFGGIAGTSWASNQLLITAQAAATTPLAVRGAASQTAAGFVVQNSAGTSNAHISVAGVLCTNNAIGLANSGATPNRIQIDLFTGVQLDVGKVIGWSASSSSFTPLNVQLAPVSSTIGIRGSSTSVGAPLNLLEQTAPSSPASNQVVIYAEDNGAGKTRLMALFNSGAAQQIAIEP